jgi:hypothetical protein
LSEGKLIRAGELAAALDALYEFDKHRRPTFVGELRPFRDDGATCEYVDMVQNIPGQSVRIYLFYQPTLGGLTTLPERGA